MAVFFDWCSNFFWAKPPIRKPAPPLLDKLEPPQKNTPCSFHCMALSQISRMGNDRARAYFKRKISEGKSKSQAFVCLRRQMVNVVWMMLKHKTIYRNAWLFLIADLPSASPSLPTAFFSAGLESVFCKAKYATRVNGGKWGYVRYFLGKWG